MSTTEQRRAEQQERVRKHYRENRQYYIDKAAAKRRRLKELVRGLKAKPCTDCGGSFHYCAMQFDHIGTDKTANISSLVDSGSARRVLNEIAKCELVCANCHAVRTFNRLKPP